MTQHPYTEDQLVEQPALTLLSELGWTTVNARDEILGADGTLGRETTSEVVLVPRLKAALERLNPDVPPEGIAAAIDQLTADRSAMSQVAANREVRSTLQAICDAGKFRFVAPPLALCTDNAAMIAWAGLERMAGGFGPDDLTVAPRSRWPLDADAAAMIGSGKRGAKA